MKESGKPVRVLPVSSSEEGGTQGLCGGGVTHDALTWGKSRDLQQRGQKTQTSENETFKFIIQYV